MTQLKRIAEKLELSYQTVENVPALYQEARSEVLKYLLSKEWIAEDIAEQLTTNADADAIKDQIAQLGQGLASTLNPNKRLRLIEQQALAYENLISNENSVEEEYRAQLQIIAEQLNSTQPEPSNDSIDKDSLDEVSSLEIRLQALNEQTALVQQQIADLSNQQASDRRREFTIQLVELQKQLLQTEKKLLFNRQAQALHQIDAPRQAEKKRLALKISRLESKKFVGDLIIQSLDRSSVLEKIRFNLRKAISDAGIAQAQADPTRRELLQPFHQGIDWF